MTKYSEKMKAKMLWADMRGEEGGRHGVLHDLYGNGRRGLIRKFDLLQYQVWILMAGMGWVITMLFKISAKVGP